MEQQVLLKKIPSHLEELDIVYDSQVIISWITQARLCRLRNKLHYYYKYR